ncbi:MAG: isoprenylcysteine carboxylmethyltransferase family protein [Planctomycetota bacterium]
MRPIVLVVVGVLIALRLAEMAYARRNTESLVARGGRRVTPDGFLGIAAVHTLWLVGMLVEEATIGPSVDSDALRIGAWTAAIASEILRLTTIATLGRRWSVHVVVVPGEPRIVRGPFRVFRHPNYVAVTLQLVSVPLALGLVWTAALVLPLKLAALVPRLRVEERALRTAAAEAPFTP